jgi:hypothetical protein
MEVTMSTEQWGKISRVLDFIMQQPTKPIKESPGASLAQVFDELGNGVSLRGTPELDVVLENVLYTMIAGQSFA